MFARALLTELITPDSGKSEKAKGKLEETGTRPTYVALLCNDSSEHQQPALWR